MNVWILPVTMAGSVLMLRVPMFVNAPLDGQARSVAQVCIYFNPIGFYYHTYTIFILIHRGFL
jgi:hypothetical protein